MNPGKSSKTQGHDIEPISVRIPDAVRMTGISRSRIYELIKDGQIEAVKLGSATLIPVEDLRRFIASLRR